MAKLKVGTIGLRAGHPRQWEGSPLVETWGVCDTDEALLAAVAKECGAKVASTDYRDLVTCREVDIVFVASPDPWHAEHACAAMRAGKHVLCEKPMVMTLEECEQVVRAADATGAKFLVGQVCRFAPGFVMAKRLIEQGLIGDLFFIESEYAHDYTHIKGVGGWRVDPVRLRYPILGGGCHAVDLLRWIGGNVAEVAAYSNRKVLADWPVDDCWIAALRFAEGGVVGKVFCGIGVKRPYTMRSVLYGTKGTIVCDNTSPDIQLASESAYGHQRFTTIPVDIAHHNKRAEIEALARAIAEDTEIELDEREGARTVATCLAIVESAQTGRAVAVRNAF
jgi:predicted dehydrogenase